MINIVIIDDNYEWRDRYLHKPLMRLPEISTLNIVAIDSYDMAINELSRKRFDVAVLNFVLNENIEDQLNHAKWTHILYTLFNSGPCDIVLVTALNSTFELNDLYKSVFTHYKNGLTLAGFYWKHEFDISDYIERIRAILNRKSQHYLPITNEVFDKYTSSIVAILDNNKTPIGTGFFVLRFTHLYVITCAHVLISINKRQDDKVNIKPFNTKYGPKTTRVVWLPQSDEIPGSFDASDDIGILEVEEVFAPSQDFLAVNEQFEYSADRTCLCFGYGYSTQGRGNTIKNIRIGEKVGMGYRELIHQGEMGKGPERRIEKGFSGAALVTSIGEFAGMINSKLNPEVAYLIPTETIAQKLQEVLS